MEMNRRHLLTGIAALGLASSANAASAGFGLRLSNEGLIMPVIVKGRPLTGILDCGASASLMDSSVAASLGLTIDRERKGNAIYKSIRTAQSAPVLIAAGDTAYTAPLMIMPLKQAGLTSDMIVGRDILDGHRLDLDGPALRATFQTRQPPLGNMTALALNRSANGTLAIDMEIDGVPVRASVDTGSNTPLILKADWAQRNGLLTGRKISQWLGGDVTGLHQVTMSSVGRATFGGLTFHDIPVEISDNRLTYDVNLGLDFFLRLRSFWDIDAGRLWISTTPDHLARPFDRERSGLAYLPQGDGLNVIFVAPQSPAEAGGWRKGDLITAIDGTPIAQMAAIDDWKRDPSRQTVRLTVASGETRTLTLQDYY
ncbi:hypothetical protein AEAC466_06240 [Asticcacaulis sp. AC466]|nr:hypothetical protein AEAC466_06240 [Asticcacaulis sp. AC466]